MSPDDCVPQQRWEGVALRLLASLSSGGGWWLGWCLSRICLNELVCSFQPMETRMCCCNTNTYPAWEVSTRLTIQNNIVNRIEEIDKGLLERDPQSSSPISYLSPRSRDGTDAIVVSRCQGTSWVHPRRSLGGCRSCDGYTGYVCTSAGLGFALGGSDTHQLLHHRDKNTTGYEPRVTTGAIIRL